MMSLLGCCAVLPANSSPTFRGACCLPYQEGTYVTTLLLQHYLYTVQQHLLYGWILLCDVLDLLSGEWTVALCCFGSHLFNI